MRIWFIITRILSFLLSTVLNFGDHLAIAWSVVHIRLTHLSWWKLGSVLQAHILPNQIFKLANLCQSNPKRGFQEPFLYGQVYRPSRTISYQSTVIIMLLHFLHESNCACAEAKSVVHYETVNQSGDYFGQRRPEL